MDFDRYNWRLSQIKEELESLDLTNDSGDDIKAFKLAKTDHKLPSSPRIDGSTSPIYCSTDNMVKPKPEDVITEEDLANDAVKKIKDKYDSLERVQKHIDKKQQAPPAEQVPDSPPASLPSPPITLELPEVTMMEMPPPSSPTMSPTERYADDRNDVFEGAPIGAAAQMASEADIDKVEGVSDDDLLQIEMFFRSHRSNVYVCPGLANLYFGTAKQDGTGDNWQLFRTGIPVLVVDSGEARRTRKAHLILAEKGSGFILWKDVLDHLSHFRAVHPNFHTLFLSTDHTKLAGFSYDDVGAANDFLSSLQSVCSDPTDEMFNMSRARKKKKEKKGKQKYKAPKKSDISQPCCFMHVTKLERSDREHYAGLMTPSNTDSIDRAKHYVKMNATNN